MLDKAMTLKSQGDKTSPMMQQEIDSKLAQVAELNKEIPRIKDVILTYSRLIHAESLTAISQLTGTTSDSKVGQRHDPKGDEMSLRTEHSHLVMEVASLKQQL